MRRLGVLIVIAVMLVLGASAAAATPSLTQVAGSPFLTGNGSDVPNGDGTTGLAFDASGDLLATADEIAGSVSVMSVGQSGALTEITGSPFAAGDQPESVAFDPTSSFLAAANYQSNNISVYRVESGGSLTAPANSPFATGLQPTDVAFSPNGGLLATANSANNVGSVSVMTVGPDGTLAPVADSPFAIAGNPSALAFNPAGSLLAVVNSQQVRLFKVTPAGQITAVSQFNPSKPGVSLFPGGASFSPNGQFLAVTEGSTGVSDQQGVYTLSVAADGSLTQVSGSPSLTGANSGPAQVAFSPDGSLLAEINGGQNTVGVFSVDAQGALTKVPGTPLVIQTTARAWDPQDLAFSPNSSLLAIANSEEQFNVGSVSVYGVSNATLTGGRHNAHKRHKKHPTLAVAPRTLSAGNRVSVSGTVAGACPHGDAVTLTSRAFIGTYRFAGLPAIYANVRVGGRFKVTTRIPSSRGPGRYAVHARCGGAPLGAGAVLRVRHS